MNLYPFLQYFASSKADPIFRGSKREFEGLRSSRLSFQSRPDLQGVKTPRVGGEDISPPWPSKADPIFRGSKLFHFSILFSRYLPKQTRSSGGQNSLAFGNIRQSRTFQSRPDLQGVKTNKPLRRRGYRQKLPKQTRSSGGQNP